MRNDTVLREENDSVLGPKDFAKYAYLISLILVILLHILVIWSLTTHQRRFRDKTTSNTIAHIALAGSLMPIIPLLIQYGNTSDDFVWYGWICEAAIVAKRKEFFKMFLNNAPPKYQILKLVFCKHIIVGNYVLFDIFQELESAHFQQSLQHLCLK